MNDNGGEYLDRDLQKFLKDEGIEMDTTAGYTPQQNSISERGNQTTTERARCMLIDGNPPKIFWAEDAATAFYIENRSPEASITFNTPHKLWYSQTSDLSHLRIFGCAAYKLIPKQFRGSKFSPISEKLIMLGYQERLHNYCLLNPATGKVTYSHDVVFDETDFEHTQLHPPAITARPDILLEEAPEYANDTHSPTPHIDLSLDLRTEEITDIDCLSASEPTASIEPNLSAP